MSNFYPRSPCGERRYWSCVLVVGRSISIHALLAESDSMHTILCCGCSDFYPRSPCGERHLRVLDGSKSSIISIHALLAESDYHGRYSLRRSASFLSTLSLRRATHQEWSGSQQPRDFYPRSPCGERQNNRKMIVSQVKISIHALLAESDLANCVIYSQTDIISIHALLAESDIVGDTMGKALAEFLSTLSLRRATVTLVLDIL